MATENTDIFPENITKILEKMDKTIEENTGNQDENINITLNTHTNNSDIDNSIVDLDKKIDETLNVLDRGVNEHKGAFDIWKTFGVELDTESFGSDDANKNRADKDAVYDQLALLAKVLNKNPKLIGNLTSLNGKNLKLVMGDYYSSNRGEYLNRGEKILYLERGQITEPGSYTNASRTAGFIHKGHNTIVAPKSETNNSLDSSLFHEYAHLIFYKIFDELGIKTIQGETVSQLVNRLKQINTFASAPEIQDNALDKFLTGQINQDKFTDIFEHPEKYQKQPNPKINTLIKLFDRINNAPELLDKSSDKKYVNDANEVFARTFENYMSAMANFYSDKKITPDGDNARSNTRHYTMDIDMAMNDLFHMLNGENISDDDKHLFEKITKRTFKGRNSTEIANHISNILSQENPDLMSITEQFNVLNTILSENNIDITKYKFSPSNINKILKSKALYDKSLLIEDPDTGNLYNPIKDYVYNFLGAKTQEDINKFKKMAELGELIDDIKDKNYAKAHYGNMLFIKKASDILNEVGYDSLSKEEIQLIQKIYNKMDSNEQDEFKNVKTSLDAAITRIPTSESDNVEEKSENRLKQECCCLNSFADSFKSITDSFKNQFESAIESTANYFKKVFESALVSYGDVLARVGGGNNPITGDKFFTGNYNSNIYKSENIISSINKNGFKTADGRTLYSQKAIDEYIKPYQQANNEFYTTNQDVIETLYGNKKTPLMLGYDPTSTFEYNLNQYPNDVKQVLSLSDRLSDVQNWRSSYTSNGKKTYEPVIEDAVIVGNTTVGDDTFNRAIRKAAFVNSNAPLMLGYDGPTVLKNDFEYDYENILGTSENQYKLKRKNINVKKIKPFLILNDNDELEDILTISQYENTTQDDITLRQNIDKRSKSRRNRYNINRLGNKYIDQFESLVSEKIYNPDIDNDDKIKDVLGFIFKNNLETSPSFIKSYQKYSDFLEGKFTNPDFPIENDSQKFDSVIKSMIDTFEITNDKNDYDAVLDMIAHAYAHGYDNSNKFQEQLDRFNKMEYLLPFPNGIETLPDFPSEIDSLPDFPEASVEEVVNDSLDSFKDLTKENEELTKVMKDFGLEFQTFNKTDRTILTAGKPGFDAGGKAKSGDLSTESWITYEKDKDGEYHFRTKIPDDKKTLKEFMDVNESVVHMQKHLEDYYRFQHNNATNMEVTPLEYLNYKYGERAQNLQKRMSDTDSGFASTVYKIGGVEHTYEELMTSDAILRDKLSKFNDLANQIAHANDIIKDENGNETGQSVNPLTTYKWLRELTELEKDIKKRTANAIKEQQTIYKELSGISKEGEKIADEGIKQADKMLASDSSYKSIFGKYKIANLSRSGKFSLTDSEKAITEFYKDQIKEQQELLKDDKLDKSGREKIRDEIKKLNGELDNYVTGALADRAKKVSGIEDDYKKNVIPALNKFNKVFGNVFNTNADIDYENIRQGGMTKMQELSKFINLDKIFNVDNIKKYAAELSKNIGTMFDSGIKMFQSAFSKITSIVGSVVKHVTILITGAFATVTAAVTGFVAGFTAMGKSIVSATDVYRKQTIALGGVYQSPTKTSRMINTVYDVTRSMPINYTQAVQTLSEMSAIPALQTILKSNDTQKSDQLLTKMFKVITAMTTMRPDQKSSDAIFSLRNAFAGDLRSLQRRFDLPTANIMNVKGTMGLAGVKTDPMAMLDSLENYFDSFLDVGTINKISDTISIIIEKIKGAIDLFKANIGNAGFYELVAEDFRKLRDIIVNFVTSADGKKLAKRISDVFSNVYESVKSIAVKFKDIISGIFNVNLNSLPELFMKGLEFFAKSVNYIDKLLNVKTVTQYVKDLVSIVINSKDVVLGYVDKIKNKLIDIASPILKVADFVIDATNDIVTVLKKIGLSDKGIFYLWLLGPSNVLNMLIGGIGAIKAAIGLVVVTVGVLYNSIKPVYELSKSIFNLVKPALTFVLGGLKKGLVFLAPYLTIATTLAVSADLIYHNWEKLGELGMNVVGSIATALEPVTNTLSDMWDIVDHMIAIGDSMIKSIFDGENWKNAAITTVEIIENVFKMALSKAFTFLPDVLPFLKLVPNFQEKLDTQYETSYGNLMTSIGNSKLIPDDVVHSWDYHTGEISKIWNRDRFGVWNRMAEGNFSDFTNLYKANQELYNPENLGFSGGYTGEILNSIKNYAVDKYNDVKSIPDKIGNFFKDLVSSTDGNSDILNGINTILGGTKKSIDYIKSSMKGTGKINFGYALNAATISAGGFVPSYIDFAGMKDARTNPFKAFLDEIDNTEVKSYSAPYESPMWTNRLTSMYMDVAKLQFQRNNIWSRNSKSSNLEKVFGTKYGNFGAQGLEELNLKKLENLKNIVQIVNEVGKIKLDAKDQEDFDKNFAEKFALAKQKTDEIDDMIRDNIEASVMLIQDTLGHTKLDYLKNDVMHYVMAEQSKFNSKLEQDINDTIRLQYSVYFATNDEFDRILGELRHSYHSIDDMYSDIAKGNVDFKDMSELGKQIAMEVAKRYEAERDYLWNLEKQRAYIEVTNKNINKMGLAELSGNWSNLMNSRYKKVRDAAGNQYMDIMKENLEQDTMGSMVRKVRDVAINSFTDMKNAVINAVQEIVKSTQQTIKTGLDKFIAEGGKIKPMFKDLYEMFKKNFFGIYTNEIANELTKFMYGSSFENGKQEDPLLLLDDDVKLFHKDMLDKMNDAILANKQALNDVFKEWLKDNPSLKPETNVLQDANTGLYHGSVNIVEKQGSNLSPLESANNDISTVVGITAEEFARNAKAVAENTNTINECAKGYRKNLDTFAGGVAYAGKKLFGFDDNIIDANDYYRALQNNKNFNTIKLDETKSLLSQLKVGDTLSWWNGKRGKEDIQQHIGVYVGNGQLASDHIEDMKNRDWLQWRLDSGYGMPQVSRLATSKTVEKPISSIDNNIEEIKNEITNVTNGDISNITRTGYVNSIVNKEIVNTIDNSINPEIKNTLDDMNFELKLDGESGGNRFSGFNIEGLNLKLDGGSSSNILSSIPLLSATSNKGRVPSLKLTGAGSNVINSVIGMAGGIGGVNVAPVIEKALNPETPLKGIWGNLFGTVENVESKFGGASVGSFLGNMMSGKGIWDSFASANTMGASTFESLAGANSFTKVATGLTSTLLGKSAGSSVAKALTGTKILGTSIGTALPVVGAVAYGISKLTKTKDKTAEGRARGEEFNTLRSSLIANRDTMARNYYMANDDTLDALKNYKFSEVAMWTSKRGSRWKGTRRKVMNTDATAFTKSIQGYWDLLQRADEENRTTQRTLNKLQNTNNLEYLRQTGSYEEKRLSSIQSDLEKYKATISKYAGHDTGFKQKLFDGKEYTLTELNDKVNDLIKELGDSKDAIAQNTEAIRQEKLATESSRLDYITALYGDINPSIAQINNKQKLENEWNSIVNEDGSIGYVKDTKEYYDYMTRLIQADRDLKNAQKQKNLDLSANWVSDLRGISMENGTYDNKQIIKLSNLYGKRESLNSQIEKAVDNMDTALAERLYDESQAITDEIEHYKSSTSFSNAINDALNNMNNVFNNVNEKVATSLTDNVNSIVNVIAQSEQWIKDAGYSGYDELDSSVLLPLFNSSFGNVNEMSSIFTEGLKSGVFDTTQINPFKEYSNSLFNIIDSFKTEYRDMVDSGATEKELQKLVKSYQNTILANVTGMNSEYEKMFKAYQQDVTAGSILNSISGFEDYTVANDALKEFNNTLGAGAMEKLIGFGGDFGSEELGKFMNVSGLNGDSDPYEMYHEWEKKHIMQRIENSEEGSEEWYAAELELWNLMADNAKYLKEKAEKTTATIEDMLNKIEETARTRVAEEAKSAKGDIIFFDLGSSREGTQFINKMLDGIDANTPESQKLMKTLKQKLMGMRR